MTSHLTPDDFVAALDGAGSAAAQHHLRDCAVCRSALVELEETLVSLKGVADVPEPSPLFWDHLRDRITHVTETVPAPSALSSWWRLARPIVALGAVAAVALVVVITRLGPASRVGGPNDAGSPEAVAARRVQPDDVSWDAMAEMASRLSADDVRVVVGPTPEAGVTELTPAEREAFVKLLGVEMGRAQ